MSSLLNDKLSEGDSSLRQQPTFAYNVHLHTTLIKLINFMRILSVAANSVRYTS